MKSGVDAAGSCWGVLLWGRLAVFLHGLVGHAQLGIAGDEEVKIGLRSAGVEQHRRGASGKFEHPRLARREGNSAERAAALVATKNELLTRLGE